MFAMILVLVVAGLILSAIIIAVYERAAQRALRRKL